MRNFALALLLAGAATAPAFAAIQERGDSRSDRRIERSDDDRPRGERRHSREESTAASPERPERNVEMRREGTLQERSIASPSSGGEGAREAAERPDRRPVMDRIREAGSRPERRRSAVVARDETPAEQPEVRLVPQSGGPREEVAEPSRPAIISTGDGLVEPTRRLPRVLDPGRPGRTVSRTPLPGTEPPEPETASRWSDSDHRRWRRDWRRDRRFDWRDHRRRHRSLFHFGFYHDPFGWGYHRYGIGWRLWPSYYGSSFWLNDPWMYRLPPSYGPYRWVRYYDDALLVNIYTGNVIDVIHDFFW